MGLSGEGDDAQAQFVGIFAKRCGLLKGLTAQKGDALKRMVQRVQQRLYLRKRNKRSAALVPSLFGKAASAAVVAALHPDAKARSGAFRPGLFDKPVDAQHGQISSCRTTDLRSCAALWDGSAVRLPPDPRQYAA